MIFANAYVEAGMVLGAALANDDVAGYSQLTTVNFYAKPFAVGFASVLGTTDAFLVCHVLWLMMIRSGLALNGCDLNFGELLTMAVRFLISLAALLLKYDHFVSFDVIQYFGRDFCSAHNRGANTDFATVVYQQHLVERQVGVYVGFQTMHENLLVLLHFELLPCDFYNCVHDG